MTDFMKTMFLCSVLSFALPSCGDEEGAEGSTDTGQADISRGRDLGGTDTGQDVGGGDTGQDVGGGDTGQDMESDTGTDTPDEVAEETGTDTGGACVAPGAGDLVVNEVLAAPAMGASGDANCDGTRNGVDDEFIELVNTTAGCLDIAGVLINKTGAVPLSHAFEDGSVVEAGGAMVIFGGAPDQAPVFDGTSSSSEAFCVDLTGCATAIQRAGQGALGLPNSQDTITISLGAVTLDTYAYGGTSGITPTDGESMVRSPEVTGDFVTHTSVNAAQPQSPGTRADGTPFVTQTGCDP